MNLTIKKIELPLKVVWKLSRNQTKVKENFIVGLDDHQAEVAPNIRYHETSERILSEFEAFKKLNLKSSEVFDYLKTSSICNSLKFALEAVYVHQAAKLAGTSVSSYLNLAEPKRVATSFSVPIMPVEGIEPYVKSIAHFPFLKIKVNAHMAFELVSEVCKFYSGPIRIDGNEAWDNLNDYLAFERALETYDLAKKVEFIEQPFAACDIELYKKLFPISKFPVMADESIESDANFSELKSMFHIVNIKLMKAGGYFKAIELLKTAKSHGLKTMLGCMVETSCGIRSAMYLNSLADYFDLDGHLLLQSDPYNYVDEENGYLNLSEN